jgi:hypothetical protein
MNLNLPFITWRELPPKIVGAKNRKVPWDIFADIPERDPHDPSWWMTSEQCSQLIEANPTHQLRQGVVLSDADPYFLLDLDDCHDGNDWVQGVYSILALFPEAAVEVSISGKGLHILGQCQPVTLGDRKNKFNLYGVECEFYHTKRFMALGYGFTTGTPDLDWTETLKTVVPTREAVTMLAVTDQADPEWSGPEDDDQLISMMTTARGSAAQMFGEKATVSDLWDADVEALGRHYPSVSGDLFDRSSADGALMAHLSFWTGKNTARMDRLFRRSGLMRPKYEKHGNYDYAGNTISGAVANTRNVYQQSVKSQPQGVVDLLPAAPDEVIEQMVLAPSGFSEIMSVDDQGTFFAGCSYIARDHSVLTPSGLLLKPAQFKTIYGGHCFLMSADGSRPSYNAFEAFTENRVTRFPKVFRTRFKPALPFGSRVGADGVNCFMAQTIRSIAGDVSPVLELLEKILPVERDRQILLSWMSAMIQNPGVKFLWSPVLQGTKGNGKSVWGKILTYCVGDKYTWEPKPKKLDAQFNAFLSKRLFVHVDEMSMFGKYEILDTLKDYITGDTQEVEQKGIDAEMDPDYCANWLFSCNPKDAVIKERDDRRFAVFFTAQQSRQDMQRDGMLSNGYFPKLWNWLKHQDGFAMMHHYLLNYAIQDEFNPAEGCFLAPDTSSTVEAVSASYGAAEQHIQEAIESEMMGFKGGWLSTAKVNELLQGVGIKRSPRKISLIIEGMGFETKLRATRLLMHEGNAKPRIYALPEISGSLEDYETAQGYR